MTLWDFLPALPDRRSAIAGTVLILAACLLAYAPSLRNDFVMWDDPLVLYSNPIAKGVTPHNVAAAFTTYDPELYVPLTVVSYQIEYMIAGRSPFLYHFDNLLLHAFNAVLVAFLFYHLFKRRSLALFFGLLFALHPLNVEAAVWISARKDVLSTFFFLLSALAYLRSRDDGSIPAYWASVVLLLLSLLSKVSLATAPALFLLFDFIDGRAWSKRMILDKLPHAFLGLAFILVALFGKTASLDATTTFQKILMACKSTVFYLQSFLVPWHLSPMYPYVGDIRIDAPAFYVPLIVLALLAAVAVYSMKYTPLIAIGAGFYLAALLPSFANFNRGEFYVASDRYAYVAMLGFFVMLAYGMLQLETRAKVWWSRFAAPLGSLVLLICIALTIPQSLVWKDSDALMSYTARVQPTAVAALINLALIDTVKARYEDALKHLDAAAAIRPEKPEIFTGRANVYGKLGRMDDAIAQCQKAVDHETRDQSARYCLAQAYHVNGDLDKALEQYRIIVEKEPHHVGAYTSMGSILLDRGNIDGAEDAFRKALAVDDTFSAGHFNLGVVLEQRHKYPEALVEFQAAAKYDTTNEEPLRHVVALAKEIGDIKTATSAAERIVWLRRNAPTGENAVLDADGLTFTVP